MLLSVIIPSYQHSDYVISCIAAAIDIPVQEKEIFVIDDGSTDDSPEIINKWIGTQSSDVNIQLISHENRGLVSVLNEGLALISGKYVYVVASEPLAQPQNRRVVSAAFSAGAGVAWVVRDHPWAEEAGGAAWTAKGSAKVAAIISRFM